MMTDKLFNSVFENSLRILILLDEYDMPQTLDMLYAVDFMTLYSKAFKLSKDNLNGENYLKFSEFASQRGMVKEALKALVLNGTVEAVGYKGGLSYIITPEGEDFCESLDSDFAEAYRKMAREVMRVTNGISERKLISEIYKMSKISIHQEVK